MRVAAVTIRRVNPGHIKTNTGNHMFTEAVYRNLDADVEWVGFGFDPDEVNERFDAVVIPAANWLAEKVDLSDLLDRVRRLKLPTTCIGLGAQASSMSDLKAKISPSTLELARRLSGLNHSISVRGEFTKALLAAHGVTNTVTTGCPSLYMDIAENLSANPQGGIVLQGTRYVMSRQVIRRDSLDNRIFAAAGRDGHDIVFQSERLEIAYLQRGGTADWEAEAADSHLPQLYGLKSVAALRAFLDAHGKVFTNLDLWSSYFQSKSGVVGTRLHGTILALNSGVPAVLLPHDSRTQELIDFAALPTARPDQVFDRAKGRVRMPVDLAGQVARYRQRRTENQAIYADFLAKNGLKFKPSNPVEDRAKLANMPKAAPLRRGTSSAGATA